MYIASLAYIVVDANNRDAQSMALWMSLNGVPWRHFFSPLGKLAGRAIYFTDVFSLFFFIFF